MGCTEWHTSARTLDGSYGPDRIPRARVTMTNGRQVVLLEAKVRTDSIVGTEPVGRARIAVAANQVARLESQEFSQLRTTLLGAFVGATFLVVTLFLVANQE